MVQSMIADRKINMIEFQKNVKTKELTKLLKSDKLYVNESQDKLQVMLVATNAQILKSVSRYFQMDITRIIINFIDKRLICLTCNIHVGGKCQSCSNGVHTAKKVPKSCQNQTKDYCAFCLIKCPVCLQKYDDCCEKCIKCNQRRHVDCSQLIENENELVCFACQHDFFNCSGCFKKKYKLNFQCFDCKLMFCECSIQRQKYSQVLCYNCYLAKCRACEVCDLKCDEKLSFVCEYCEESYHFTCAPYFRLKNFEKTDIFGCLDCWNEKLEESEQTKKKERQERKQIFFTLQLEPSLLREFKYLVNRSLETNLFKKNALLVLLKERNLTWTDEIDKEIGRFDILTLLHRAQNRHELAEAFKDESLSLSDFDSYRIQKFISDGENLEDLISVAIQRKLCNDYCFGKESVVVKKNLMNERPWKNNISVAQFHKKHNITLKRKK